VAAFKGGLVFISEDAKSRCALVHGAFRRSFQKVLSKRTRKSTRTWSRLAHRVPGWRSRAEPDKSLGPIGRRRRARSVWTSHRQFLGRATRQLLWTWRWLGIAHRRRHFGLRIARRAFPRRLRRLPRLDRRILLRIDRHFAVSGTPIPLALTNGMGATKFHGASALIWVLSASANISSVIVSSGACCCGFSRSRRNRAGACRQCSPRAIRCATDARSPPRPARAMAARA
jgi:hypothetical protein